MGTIRHATKVWKSQPTIEGAGVHLNRAFGSANPRLDPFLLLDDFRGKNPRDYIAGFPWHPHRGIETITYMLAGTVEHGDSMGNAGVIGPGDVQWMTAGSGIIHQEMPKGDPNGVMGGFQLWANLPAASKMMDPRYRGLTQDEIPAVETSDGAVARVIAGTVEGTTGPVQDVVTQPTYMDVTVPAGATFHYEIEQGKNVFAYVIDGGGFFDPDKDFYAMDFMGGSYCDLGTDCLLGERTLVSFDNGDEIQVSAQDEAVRFLLAAAFPLNEPVAWYGPIVMNTREELRIAFEEYQNGTFVKATGKE
jgi:hypothetical protein